MKPREIDVHIEELVLHGFVPGTRWDIAEAIQNELSTLLVERGIPEAWQANPEHIDAGTIQTGARTKPAATGEQVARAVYGGVVR